VLANHTSNYITTYSTNEFCDFPNKQCYVILQRQPHQRRYQPPSHQRLYRQRLQYVPQRQLRCQPQRRTRLRVGRAYSARGPASMICGEMEEEKNIIVTKRNKGSEGGNGPGINCFYGFASCTFNIGQQRTVVGPLGRYWDRSLIYLLKFNNYNFG